MLESISNKETPTWMFSCEYWKIFKNTYFEEHLGTDASLCFPVFRSNYLRMFFKIGVLKNFANLTGNYLCWNLCLIKLLA